jgi:glutamyl-tRNA reductase
MNVFCIGLSHHQTNVETRESFAGDDDSRKRLHNLGCAEALLLSTCNRVEVYAASEQVVTTEMVARCLAREPERFTSEMSREFYRYEGQDCINHLFRVASGLDSMVIGETEILGQAKKAYESAHHSGSAGRFLHRLCQRAFRVAKEVRTHTEITRGSVSVGSVAVELAVKIFGDLSSRHVLVLGAGETSEKTTRALVSRGVTDLLVSNRSRHRAEEMANNVGVGRVVDFDDWIQHCASIDILITSTASPTPLVRPDNIGPVLRNRVDRPLFIIDMAVPRDVHPDVNKLEGVYLYDMDSLQSVAEQSLALRRQQMTIADSIIAGHVSDFWERYFGAGARPFGYRTSLPASELGG